MLYSNWKIKTLPVSLTGKSATANNNKEGAKSPIAAAIRMRRPLE